jgi:hypothetical protein
VEADDLPWWMIRSMTAAAMSRWGEHVAPPAELQVAGVEGASPFVTVGDDLEQEPGPVVGAWAGNPTRR